MSIDVMSSEEAYAAFYERLGKCYPESEVVYAEPLGRARRTMILACLKVFAARGFSLLDAGCNSGDYSLHYASLGGVPHGIDISRSLISAAVARAAAANLTKATFQVGNVETYTGGPYDAVLFSEVLEHLRDPRSAVQCLAGCLRPRGYLLLSTPAPARDNVSPLRFVMSRIFSAALMKNKTHESERTQVQGYVSDSYHYRHDEYFPMGLARWVESFGFQRVKICTFFTPERFLRLTNAFPMLQSRVPFLNLICLNNLHLYRRTLMDGQIPEYG